MKDEMQSHTMKPTKPNIMRSIFKDGYNCYFDGALKLGYNPVALWFYAISFLISTNYDSA